MSQSIFSLTSDYEEILSKLRDTPVEVLKNMNMWHAKTIFGTINFQEINKILNVLSDFGLLTFIEGSSESLRSYDYELYKKYGITENEYEKADGWVAFEISLNQEAYDYF